tara:strand:+ start:1194 stop:1349 length:156 start_codon:yes stop_codon:yes gene_type:complete
MMEDLINRVGVSFVGVLASWGLMDVSLLLASIASIMTIIYTAISIYKLLHK